MTALRKFIVHTVRKNFVPHNRKNFVRGAIEMKSLKLTSIPNGPQSHSPRLQSMENVIQLVKSSALDYWDHSDVMLND